MTSMNYDEMRGKQSGATLLGHDQFYFFPLLLNNDYCVFSYCGDVKGPIYCNSWGLSVGMSAISNALLNERKLDSRAAEIQKRDLIFQDFQPEGGSR